MKEIKVRLTFTEPLLGTSPANEDIYREFIGSKAPDASTVDEEVEALGADAVVNIRYGSSSVMQGAAEVIAYGTAVKFK